MIKRCELSLSPEESANNEEILRKVSSAISKPKKEINGIQILKKNIDSRREKIKVNFLIDAFIDEDVPLRYRKKEYKNVDGKKNVIIVGSGPSGLSAALTLLEFGIRPIILEQGKNVRERKIDCANLSRHGLLNKEDNYTFGEGGAGAYSDGKLFTRSGSESERKEVFSTLVDNGADESIFYESHPHLGTDRLPRIIENIRKKITAYGGEILFNKKVDSLLIKNGECYGVKCSDGDEILSPVLLSPGHAAKDLFYSLYNSGITLLPKDVAIGVRCEKSQREVDEMQYHKKEGRGKFLPPATYTFKTQVNGRGVYSFCMCPGGYVLLSSTEEGLLRVNGASSSFRSSKYSNAAFVTEIRVGDLKSSDDPFSMLNFVEEIERRSYSSAFRASAVRLEDFLCNVRISHELPRCTYAPEIISGDLYNILGFDIAFRLSEGFRYFNKITNNKFVSHDTVLIASETRTSSPIKIVRDQNGMVMKGLFVSGEGSGYAGGITSSMIDGSKIARNISSICFGL